MPNLKPWYQVITPREDLRENRPMDASEFAVHLDHIREGRENVSKDYSEPDRFFDRTYLTESLLQLCSQVVRRLSGVHVETSAVFNMATQFGGGKTHSLTTIYHLARHGEKAKSWKGVERILDKAGVPQVPKADVAVFVGSEFDVIQGRGGNGQPVRKTPWGEIAWQLGGEQALAAVAEHDARGLAPAGDALRSMLPSGPTLILMDELMNYMSRGRKMGLRDQFFDFLQNLSEEARARKNMVLCVSIPASDSLEMNPDDERDHAALKKLLDRLGKAIMMSAGAEIAEIIRRRLFEWFGMSEDARRTASAYAEWTIEHAQELTGIDADSVYEQFQSCYPFHPTVLSVFERKWQSLPRFQRTRGILRLLALWVAHAYQDEHRKASGEPLITLGSAPLENPIFRAAMFEQLGSTELEIPVTTDIAGKKDAHAVRLDREANEAIKKATLHRKVATTILFESNGGMSQSKAEAALPEIRLGVGGPELNFADVDHVLEGLVSTCYYLNWDRNRYRFGLTPNLNQILVTRRGAVKDKEIDERIKQQTQKLFGEGPKEIERRYFPVRSNDVRNLPTLTLVVLGLENTLGDKATHQMMDTIVRECGTSGRTYKSALIFAVPDAAETIREATRNLLAWEGIDDDEETKSRIDEAQTRLLARNLHRAESDMKESIWRAYRNLFLLGTDNQLRQIDLGQVTSSMAKSIVELYLNELIRTDDVTKGVGANKLVRYWPPALTEWSTKGARDAFYSSPQLPRLLDGDAIKRTISDGVGQGTLGYATKDGHGKLQLDRFKTSLVEGDVEISDDVFILKAEDAQKLLEPPRLAQLLVQPPQASMKPGQQQSFTCSAWDQYAQHFATPSVVWKASGGTISDEGLLMAGETEGRFTVHATAQGIECIVEIHVAKDELPPSPLPHQHVIRWSGEIPPQKWMVFYTKILTRFVSTKELKLRVSFEVPAEGDQGAAKAKETKTGLKELGLDDNVDIR
jgi:hypothetical protein